jgi:hypothetical protein
MRKLHDRTALVFLTRPCALAWILCLALPASAQPQLVAAMDSEGGSVRVIDPAGGGALFEPFGPGFSGGVRVAAGDINGDGVPDIIVGSGPGIAAGVRIFDGASLQPAGGFEPFGTGFLGGVFVGTGDVNGDGRSDIISGAGPGTGAVVRIHDGRTQTEVRTFTAYSGFTGGVRVAAGDVNGDGRDDIITGAGPGGGPHVKVFDGRTGDVLHDFQAFSNTFSGGIFVGAGDFNGDFIVDLAVASAEDPVVGAGGGPHVKVFSGNDLTVLADFRPFTPSFTGGVRVAMGDLNDDGLADVITAPGNGGAPQLSRWLAPNATPGGELLVFTPGYLGGVFVASTVPIPTIHRDGFE